MSSVARRLYSGVDEKFYRRLTVEINLLFSQQLDPKSFGKVVLIDWLFRFIDGNFMFKYVFFILFFFQIIIDFWIALY